jgi:hypothetical protein
MTAAWQAAEGALTFDLSGPPKAGPLEGRVRRHRQMGGRRSCSIRDANL